MKEFEDYVKHVLKIPYCNFDGLHPKIAYEIIVGLSLMYEMYPAFNKVICAIEPSDNFTTHMNLLSITSGVKNPEMYFLEDRIESCYGMYGYHENNDWYYKLPKYIDKNIINYFSFIIFNGSKMQKHTIEDIYWHSANRLGVYHEFGHILDRFLHISNSDEFKRLIKGHDIEKEISRYSTTDNKEAVAEAFSFYILAQTKLSKLEKDLEKYEFLENNTCTKVTPLVYEIGKLIDKKYEEFVKKEKINLLLGRYNFNKRFDIRKTNTTMSNEQIEKQLKKVL